jgi:hypothetical protein
MACTACLVCLISTVEWRQYEKIEKTLDEAALFSGHITNLKQSIFYFEICGHNGWIECLRKTSV